MKKTVPLVVYDENRKRQIVGEMEVDSETFKGTGVITSENLAISLGFHHLNGVSIGLDPDTNPEEPPVVLDTHIQYELLPGGYPKLDVNQMEEIDRCARAYGFEIGRGHALAQQITDCSEDNPFLDPDWRDRWAINEATALMDESERLRVRSDHEFGGITGHREERHIPDHDENRWPKGPSRS